tara:strand:+ start:549 stop:1901 length:1353 start_codon:yes stop_codon:yes gene_type:complete
MHLFAMPMGSGGHLAGWRLSGSGAEKLMTLEYWKEIAQLSEAGCFDALFIADSQGFRIIEGADAFCQTDAVRLDPVTLLAALSACTRHLGLVATMSTSYNEPYIAARRLATLDHLSGGRAAWNVVTSTSENEAHNFGRDVHFGHAERYERASEFVDVVKALWDGWDDDAFEYDRQGARFFNPDKVHGLYYKGDHFSVAGPLTLGRPPQGHPVIVQAGASSAGLDLAARTADAVFTSHPKLESAIAFYADLKARVVAAGRPADSLKIMCAIQPVAAASKSEAEAEVADLNALIPDNLAMGYLQMSIGGVDLSAHDPDGPLPNLPASNASQATRQRIIDMSEKQGMSIRQIARKMAESRTSHALAGTPGMIADQMQEWFEKGAADGFVIAPPALPMMLRSFVELVVPELQSRGLLRVSYEGDTLRDRLGLQRPVNRYEVDPSLHQEPEIWHP